MIGIVSVKIKDSRNSYSFELKRNITVLCGDSGRGKTTLYDMVSDFNRFGKNSGTKISCDKEIVAVGGKDWKTQIESLTNTIIIIDEDNAFIRSKDFAETIRFSDNYYLLITRGYLPQLPISVTEFYELSGGKNKKFVRLYDEEKLMYNKPNQGKLPFKPDAIVTEDSGSGYQFFSEIAKSNGIKCVSACGKSNIYKEIQTDEKILVIADGAAFGAEMAEIVKRQNLMYGKIGIFLPESFEWLLLKSNTIATLDDEKLNKAENYADSRKFFSFEQYFTDLLVSLTKNNEYTKYSKNNLPAFYFSETVVEKVKKLMEGIDFGK